MTIEKDRKDKLNNWFETENFEINCSLNYKFYEEQKIKAAGRIVFFRDMGQLCFGKISDVEGILQFSIRSDKLENYKFIKKNLDVGDIIGIIGTIYRTQKGELTLETGELFLLKKGFKNLPEKWSGIKNVEIKRRQRYLDLICNKECQNIFNSRINLIKKIKNFLDSRGFLEVETPILQNIASGAAANPFKTKHDALDLPMYLRIAPELFLKRMLIGGYNKIFEIGKCFRNEGIDSTHLQEFTMLEMYQTYISYEKLMDLSIELIQECVKVFSEDLIIKDINFQKIEKISYLNLLNKYGIVIKDPKDEKELTQIAQKNNINIDGVMGYQAILDRIYKYKCIKNIVQPLLVYDYPRSPLSKKSKDPRLSQQFQIILQGQEIIKACIENNDIEDQRFLMEEQDKLLKDGDKEIVRTDYEFLEALEYGMPPSGGLGMGIDRIFTILTQSESIKDIVMFPNLK